MKVKISTPDGQEIVVTRSGNDWKVIGFRTEFYDEELSRNTEWVSFSLVNANQKNVYLADISKEKHPIINLEVTPSNG